MTSAARFNFSFTSPSDQNCPANAHTTAGAYFQYTHTPTVAFSPSYEFVRLDGLGPPSTQCVQIITSSLIASNLAASLPPHCGNMVKRSISSSWWGSTDMYVGVGRQPHWLDTGHGARIDPSDGWWEVNRLRALNFFELSPLYKELVILTRYDQYIVMPKAFLEFMPRISFHKGDAIPTLRWFVPRYIKSEDNRYCIPYIRQQAILALPIYNTYYDAMSSLAIPIHTAAIEQNLITRFSYYINNTHRYVVATGNSSYECSEQEYNLFELVNCDPHEATSNVLPFNISSLAYSLANAILSSLVTLAHYLRNVISEASSVVTSTIHIWLPAAIAYYPFHGSNYITIILFAVVYIAQPLIPLSVAIYRMYRHVADRR